MSGLTYSGGIDVNLNVLKVFDEVMRAHLASCASFEAFYEKFMTRLAEVQDDVIRFTNN
jgi:RecJ-like exonuclease